ncbi:MAG: signal peptidase I [Firmicutes bacterium]|nr:signal peptidase I [Bacillota bacterium]
MKLHPGSSQPSPHRPRARLLCSIVQGAALFLTVFVIGFAGLFTLPRLIGIEPYIVMSGSMEPAIHTGSVAFVDTGADRIKEGDIIAYELASADAETVTITHRVIAVTPEGWITRGDANRSPDEGIVKGKQLVGRYLFCVPGAGYLLNGREKELGLLGILWVLAANLLAGLLPKLLEETAGNSQPSITSCTKPIPKGEPIHEPETHCHHCSLRPGGEPCDRLDLCLSDRPADREEHLYRRQRGNLTHRAEL